MDSLNLSEGIQMTTHYYRSNLEENDTLNHTYIKHLLNKHLHEVTSDDSEIVIGLLILYIPTFFVGFLGNGFLAVIILSNTKLRNITNLFLVNLACTDLAVTIICIPIAVGQALYKLWIYGEFMCKLTGFLQGVAVAASVFTITLLSIDRYLAIKHPMVFRRLSTNSMAIRLICVIWFISIGLMIPLLIVRKVTVMDLIPTNIVHFCGEHWSDDVQRQRYDIALFIIVYIIPGTIICSSYGQIGSELWTEDKTLNRSESQTSKGLGDRMMKGRKRVAKMLISLAVLFAVCWLPYYCVSLYLDFHSSDKRLLVVLPYTIFLGHSNSAFNPVLYFYSSKSFRGFLVRMLKCKRHRFKPVRRENMIVRCTRNNANTTTELTRRPFIRILSNSSLVSRSGSLRFSRSNTGSLKSSSGTNRTSFRSTTSRTSDQSPSHRSPRKKEFDKYNEKNSPQNPQIAVVEPTYITQYQHFFDNSEKSYHKKAIMEATISVPTTINEESSRHNSLVPPFKLSPCPSIEAIFEESNESTASCTENVKCKESIPMTTFVYGNTLTPVAQKREDTR